MREMAGMLSDLIQTAPAFRAAVNIELELDDFEKAAAYLPTAKGAEVLFDMGRQLEPTSRNRQRLITGTYGTGKSHLALVLAALYRGYKSEVQPVLARLKEKFPGRTEQLEEALMLISRELPFLVVIVEGDQDDFDAALVRGLNAALKNANVTDLIPETYFEAAAQRLQELAEDTEAVQRLHRALEQLNYTSWESLQSQLINGSLDALKTFNELHQRVCFGAEFMAEQRISAAATYRQAAEQLVAMKKFKGIVVIWDEFGHFMERIVSDPGAVGGAIQRFAETCQDSGENQIHLYLIAHRTLNAYIDKAASMGLSATQQQSWREDFRKTMGRFKEFFMETQQEELFQLIDQAIIQLRDNGWDAFVREHDSDFAMLTDETFRAELYPDLKSRELRNMVIEGCYPLHPTTVALLPRISELVAQNQRTMFTFLCAREPRTLGQFLDNTPIPQAGEPLPVVMADILWDYFREAIQEDDMAQRVFRLYREARARLDWEHQPELAERVLKLLALFDLLALGPASYAYELKPTESNLALALNLTTDIEKKELKNLLEHLSQRGPNRVLVRFRDGTYRMISGTGQDLEDAVTEVINKRQAVLNIPQLLRQRWGPRPKDAEVDSIYLDLYETIDNVEYDSDVIARTVRVVPIVAKEMEDLRRWTDNIGGGQFWDGVIFVVLPTEDAQIGAAKKATLDYADQPQIVFAVPNKPLYGLEQIFARMDALEIVAKEEASLWGPNGDRRDEWDAEYEQVKEELSDLFRPIRLEPYSNEIDLTVIWQGEPVKVVTWSDLMDCIEKAMANAFAKTPKIRDEVMGPVRNRDGTTRPRRAVIDFILDKAGPKLLESEKDKARVRFISILKAIGAFKTSPRPKIVPPDPSQDPGAAEVWEIICQFANAAKERAQPLTTLTNKLRAAPYGIGTRVLALLFAAALRDDLGNGNLRLERQSHGQAWQNVERVDGEALDNAFREPASYQFRYIEFTDVQLAAAKGLILAVAGENAIPENNGKVFDVAKEAIAQWWARLPQYCKSTEDLDTVVRRIRDEVLRGLVSPNQDAYEIFTRTLWTIVKPQDYTVEQFARSFRQWLNEIEHAAEKFRQHVATAILNVWGSSDLAPTEENVHEVLSKWWESLPSATRSHIHTGDRCKLQKALQQPREGFIDALASHLQGRCLEDWSEDDLHRIEGRLFSAKEDLERWEPPAKPGAIPQEGQAHLTISAHFPGEDTGFNINRVFNLKYDLTPESQMLLRFLIRNFAEDQSLQSGEKETVLIQFLRTVLENG